MFLKWYSVFAILIILICFNYSSIEGVMNSNGINTRGGQISDYINDINSSNVAKYITGSGIGTPYKSDYVSNDYGEVKIIDKSTNFYGYRFIFQTPFLVVFKYSGIIGLLSLLIFSLYLFKILYVNFKLYSDSSFERVEFITLSFIFVYYSLTQSFLIGGTSPIFAFLGFIVARLVFLNEYLNHNENESYGTNEVRLRQQRKRSLYIPKVRSELI
ncbi:hypothetical protein NYE40_06665 [Paenibacillus sp. FSL W8-1187]|uniref:hypothetical protein n=1 Tax=Paenibacillus sp. FSL W8-1187 TaxID=2975339 RepID=UPI0030DC1476